jgi:hypothetical protein
MKPTIKADPRRRGSVTRTRDPNELQRLAVAAVVAELSAMGVEWTEASTAQIRRSAGINYPGARPNRYTYRGETRQILANWASLENYGWWAQGGITARKLALLSVLCGIPDWRELCEGAGAPGRLDPSAADAIADERKKQAPYAKSARVGRPFVKIPRKVPTPTS